jgi:AcrR family transcriptional regulator
MPVPAEEKKRRILDATRSLLVSRGFQDLALDEVARKAGVAKGTLFLYYKSKDALFSSAFADLMHGLAAALDEAAAASPSGAELLPRTARAILDYFDRNLDFMSQFGAGRFPGCGGRSCDRLMEKMVENMKRVADALSRYAKETRRPIENPERAAVQLFGLCRASLLYHRMTGRDAALETRTAAVIEMFLHGVGGGR